MTMVLASTERTSAARSTPEQGWFRENRSSIIRHVIINFFMIVILAPLAWVLVMSIKSRSDAMRPDFWPRRFDFSHYAYVFDKIETFLQRTWSKRIVTL